MSDSPDQYPIDGTLDLHTFHPRDLPEVVNEFIHACRQRNILAIRIIHGKGTGVQRKRVQTLLDRHPAVIHQENGGVGGGGWGATLATLLPADSEPANSAEPI